MENATDRTAMEPRSKAKVTLSLDEDAAQCLAVHAVLTQRHQSSIVDELINAKLRRFVVEDLGPDA